MFGFGNRIRFEKFRKFGYFFFLLLFFASFSFQTYDFIVYRKSYEFFSLLVPMFFTFYFQFFYGIEAILKRFDEINEKAKKEALEEKSIIKN